MQEANEYMSNPFFWLGMTCSIYFASRFFKCFAGQMHPYLRSYFLVLAGLAGEPLGWWGMRGASLYWAGLVILDRLIPTIVFPPLSLVEAARAYSPLLSKPAIRNLDFTEFKDPNHKLRFIRPSIWREENIDGPPDNKGLLAVGFRGEQTVTQWISVWVNDAESVQRVEPEALDRFCKRQVLSQNGKVRSYGFVKLGEDTPVYWIEYSLGGLRVERRVYFIVDGKEFILSLATSMVTYRTDLMIFDNLLRSLRYNDQNLS